MDHVENGSYHPAPYLDQGEIPSSADLFLAIVQGRKIILNIESL
jgi:hypothetical protein